MDLKGKRVALIGYGIENQALLPYLHGHGAAITICDRNEQLTDLPAGEHRLGKDYLDHLIDFEIIFRSPGVPYLTREIQAARQAGVTISSQIKLFLAESPASVIGVTGTKGKSTTAALLQLILQEAAGKNDLPGRVYLAGNIGAPPITLLPILTDKDWVILELSSFQLQDVSQSPNIAVVLNVAIDHLDHHRDEADYISAKKNIVRYQTPDDYLVVNLDSLTSILFADETPAQTYFFSCHQSVDQGCFIESRLDNDAIVLRLPGHEDKIICRTDEVKLVGRYNLENVTAAAAASALAGASIKAIQTGVKNFTGLPHRLEFVAKIDSVSYYDDSKATTPEAAAAAILSFAAPITLLAGGSPKGVDYAELVKVIMNSTVRNIIAMGPEGQKIKRLLKAAGGWQPVHDAGPTMPDIVRLAVELAQPGGVVLLSPGAASFDMFVSAEDRGLQFQTSVKEELSGAR